MIDDDDLQNMSKIINFTDSQLGVSYYFIFANASEKEAIFSQGKNLLHNEIVPELKNRNIVELSLDNIISLFHEVIYLNFHCLAVDLEHDVEPEERYLMKIFSQRFDKEKMKALIGDSINVEKVEVKNK